MEANDFQSHLVVVTNKSILRFVKVYLKPIIILITPLILIPVATIGNNNAYLSFYVFLLMAIYWSVNVLHPGVTSLIPIAYYTIFGAFDKELINIISIGNSVVESLGVMIMVIAIEQSNIHKRIAIKILLIFGCSHFRLSFLLFFITMVLSMWFTNSMACGLMMPVVKAILKELEKMGILETREITSNLSSDDEMMQRPSDFAVFYFLGIAYSSSIGGITTIAGSESNQVFRNYCTKIFPQSPRLEVPHYMLLTLPGMLIMEMCLYIWLNFYFLGMLRVHNYTALQATLTGDEEQYITMLLNREYEQMGKMKFHEILVSAIIVFTAILQSVINGTNLNNFDQINTYKAAKTSAPSILSIILLFIMPAEFECFKSFGRNTVSLPTSASKAFLSWSIVIINLQWSVLFVIGRYIFFIVSSYCSLSTVINTSSNMTLEALKYSKMTDEFEKFLLLVSKAPRPVMALVVVLLCKFLTEFATNCTVVHCMLPHIANVSVKAKVNPLYLMLSATLSSSLPFHLITGTPAYAMISAYVNIPHRKMIIAGIGPSIIGLLTNLFTICIWSKVIWPDIDTYPKWAEFYLKIK